MKKFELINCEGTVLECKIDRIENVSVNVYLYKEAGYLKFRPLLKDLYKYLLGCITLEDVLKTSKNIKVNNIEKEIDHIDIDGTSPQFAAIYVVLIITSIVLMFFK